MGLKKYIVASVIFIAAVAAYVFSIAQTDYQITLFDTTLLLPVALWVILPLLVLFVASVFHMIFYGLKGYMVTSSLNKDESNMIKLIKNKLLKKDETIKFKNPIFQELGEILSQVDVQISSDDFTSKNSEINDLAKSLIEIKNQKFVSLNYKLNANNEIAIANNINKINEQADWAIEVLKKSANYTQKEIEAAFTKVLNDKSMTTLKKILPNLKLSKSMIQELFKKDSAQAEFSLSSEELIKYIKQTELNKQEFLEIAKLYKTSLTPDEIIGLFEELSNANEAALDAYVYILFEYEMIDKIRDIFSSTSSDELTAFKALLELKDSGKQYTLDSICYYK
ncbi:MAG: hypothetical protein AB7V28_12060 [Arcobacteraceae bacterium]